MLSWIDWNEIQYNTYQYLKTLTSSQIKEIIEIADYHYHNGKGIITDAIYDLIVEYLEELTGCVKQNVGAKITINKKKVKLPYYMGSMRKYKPKDNFNSWCTKYGGSGYMISDKLDGTSGMIEYKDGEIKIYTRGNGYIGQDISYLQEFIYIPKLQSNITVRG